MVTPARRMPCRRCGEHSDWHKGPVDFYAATAERLNIPFGYYHYDCALALSFISRDVVACPEPNCPCDFNPDFHREYRTAVLDG